jgi:hypothetical protein
VKNSVHTMAERVLQLSIVSSFRLRLETRSRAGKTSFSALGAKYTNFNTLIAFNFSREY